MYFIDPTSSECILYESDLNGDNRRGIAKLNEKQKHAVATLELPIYFYDDKMYFGMTYSDFLEKPITEENGTVKNMKDTWEIIEVSLSDGTITSVKEPEEIDMTNSYVTIDEYFGDSVLFSLGRDMYLYDMKNKEEKQVFSGNDQNNYIGINVEKGMLYYWKDTEQETEVFQVDMNSLEEKSVIKKKKNWENAGSVSCINGDCFSLPSRENDSSNSCHASWRWGDRICVLCRNRIEFLAKYMETMQFLFLDERGKIFRNV